MLGPFAAFFSSVTWALGSAAYSKMTREATPFAVNFARALFALPLFLVSLWWLEGGLVGFGRAFEPVRASHVGWLALSIFASYGIGDALFLWGAAVIGISSALAIASCYPIWTTLLGVLFQGDHVTLGRGLGLLVTVAGAIVVILNAPRLEKEEGRRGSAAKGVLLAVAASLMWTVNSYSVSQAGREISVFVANVIRMSIALGLSFALSRLMAPGRPILLGRRVLVRSAWLFAFEGFGGSVCYLYGLAHSPLVVGSTLTSLAPVISVPIAWALGLEKPSLPRTLGVLTVVLGLWLLVG